MGSALNRKAALLTASLFLSPLLVSAQAAQAAPGGAADAFFAEISDTYSRVKDYEANLTITRGKDTQVGTISYKTPVFLNVKFDTPKDEVINFNGEDLIVYDPADAVVLKQTFKKKTPAQLEGLVSSQGLGLWQRNFTVSFLTGPAPVPLEDGSREQVVKLKLQSKGGTFYSQMIVSVSRDQLLVRRVEGTLGGGDKVVMDFTNVRTNQGLPDSRFDYKEPPNVYMQPDWLFDPEE
jgi:outer membrane lipoprotein-sorting protein